LHPTIAPWTWRLLDAADQPECVSTAVRATAADTDEDMADMAADETMTRRALELLAY
jgi:hypothetical protein